MPMLDVSVALTDPYTLDVFDVIRRPETMSSFGESTVQEETFSDVHGVVYPAGENALDRRPEMQTQQKAIEIITRFALRGNREAQGTNYQPDLVVWGGNRFIVNRVEDYSKYAAGFILASCLMMDMTAQAETTS